MLKAHIKDDFKDLLEYREWINNSFQNLSQQNKIPARALAKDYVDKRIRTSPTWYGPDTSFEEMERGITQYKNPELLEEIYSKVSEQISLHIRNKVKARKLAYNATGLGVFIFDRAAMSLYLLKEYYSSFLQKVVDRKDVTTTPNGFALISDGTPVIERWEEKANGKRKVRTSNKTVFAWFPPNSKEKRAIEMFISCGGSFSVEYENFLYSGIGAIIIAQLLEKARIPTKISIVIGSSPDGFIEDVFAAIVPVKNYDERLDINLLALLTSDPRFFRFEGFKGVISTYNHFKAIIPESLGTGMNREHLIETIEGSDYLEKVKLAPNRFYFGWTFNEKDAIDNINKTMEELAVKLND